MSNVPVANEGDPLEPGQIRFYCSAEPPLQAGGYQFQAQQSVDGLKSQPDDNQFGAQSAVVVTGPRFRLPPQDLQLVYPPANETGSYEQSLPHVVLRTRTLPWVRSIDGSSTNPSDDLGQVPPWVALIMLYPDEIGDQKPTTMTVSELITPSQTNILPPTLVDADMLTPDEKSSQLLGIDLDLATFKAIVPSLSELPFLSHVREVNTDQKEIMNMVEDGWFSVVVGNRLPKTGSQNTCMLVSLEGHQDHLYGGPAIDSKYTKIRLACLAKWNFTANPARGSFLQYMQNLCQRGGVDLLQPIHYKFNASPTAPEQNAQEALSLGYLPCLNSTRSGESTTSWYRGPLTPVPTTPDTLGPYFFSDRAIRYDSETGLFNMAYACAWQIGQLLGLSDAAFASSLFQWRITQYQSSQRDIASQHLDEFQKEWNLDSSGVKGVTPLVMSVMSKATQATTAKNSSTSSGPTQMKIAKVQPHHRRDAEAGLLPGVLPEDLWHTQIDAGEDPIHILHQHLKQPAKKKA